MVAKLTKIVALTALAAVAAAQSSSSTSSSSSSESSSSTSESSSSSSSSSSSESSSSTSESSTSTITVSSTISSTSSSATGGPTGGPQLINAVPAGATTDQAGGFFLGLPSGVNAKHKRQDPAGGFIGGANCNTAAVFTLEDGVLKADGVAYGTGVDQTAITFAAARGAAGVQTTWFIEADGTLGWFNDDFYNNQAGFCSVPAGDLFITFITPAAEEYPEDCETVALEAIDADRCVNGEIVPIGGGGAGCEYPIGIPRSDDFYITGCPTPVGESCVSTTVSWIPGELTFLPDSDL